jgi:hypothetical protein
MLQIDHVYEFLYQELFKDFEFWHLMNGVPKLSDQSINDIMIFTKGPEVTKKIFQFDQEPYIKEPMVPYLNMFLIDKTHSADELFHLYETDQFPYGMDPGKVHIEYARNNLSFFDKQYVFTTSEHSADVDACCLEAGMQKLYYFFHGFAALDWYRGHHALNYSRSIVKSYKYDFISYNRIIDNDRSYRIYFVSKLVELGLLAQGRVSFSVTDDLFDDWRDEVANPKTKLSTHARNHAEQHLTDINKLVIDRAQLPGSASASIPRTIPGFWPNNDQPNVDALWHIVTETVFYYDKLHLTEKIFKPIVSKQPFMLLAAPGNLAYLRSYGFKTFEGIIDESYDTIEDNDLRIEAVVAQLQWYCNLSPTEKQAVIERLAPIVEYNFHHFYGEFRHIITKELLANTKSLFKEIGYDDSDISYENIYLALTK